MNVTDIASVIVTNIVTGGVFFGGGGSSLAVAVRIYDTVLGYPLALAATDNVSATHMIIYGILGGIVVDMTRRIIPVTLRRVIFYYL
jgi:hypothetical protein